MAKEDELVTTHLYIAKYLARRYSRSSAPFDDLYQEGCIGLIKASKKFEVERGFKFSTYATWWVRQAILSSLTTSTRTIRLPSHIVQLKLKIFRFSEAYLNQHGKEPSLEEIGTEIDLEVHKVEKILNLQLEVDIDNFEAFMTKDEDNELEKLEKEEEHDHVVNKLTNLTLKEKIVIGLQYGLLSKIK